MVTQRALLDELQKIAEATDRKTKLKRWAKNTALIAGGVGAAEGASQLAAKFTKDQFGKKWSKLAPSKRVNILRPVIGGLTAGTAVAAALHKKRSEEAERD